MWKSEEALERELSDKPAQGRSAAVQILRGKLPRLQQCPRGSLHRTAYSPETRCPNARRLGAKGSISSRKRLQPSQGACSLRIPPRHCGQDEGAQFPSAPAGTGLCSFYEGHSCLFLAKSHGPCLPHLGHLPVPLCLFSDLRLHS